MKPQEAIERMKNLKDLIGYDQNDRLVQKTTEALNMAIESLVFQKHLVRCFECMEYDELLKSCLLYDRRVKKCEFCSRGERRDEE